MRLIAAELSGYKRFAAQSEIDLDDSLVCIVGPNGAGKSSFLDALVHLSNDDDFVRSERTRTEDGGVLAPLLVARYGLDDDDRTALSEIPEASEVEEFVVVKDDAHGRTDKVEPQPERDREPRARLLRRLVEFRESPWIGVTAEAEAEVEPDAPTVLTVLESGISACELEDETLEQEELGALQNAAGRLERILEGQLPDGVDPLPKKYERLATDLRNLVEVEQKQHPAQWAEAILRKRRPDFIKFEQSDRDLRPQYDLVEDESDYPIEHLLALAGSSWDEVRQVIASGDKGRKNVLLERLNGRLEREITEAWGQTPLTVKLDIDGPLLTILMSMQADDYISIDQHSDGLRQFVALKAFLALHVNERPSIVLIDEAELHLHYDAQADLVTAFEEQVDVAGIIYTTHSAGCLPRDLGTGLRGIVPIFRDVEGREPVMTDHSRLVNGFWFSERGFSPLLIAMGASAFAFSAAQKAAVTEGFTDALLLPSLIREACGIGHLEYQIVPGFARAQPNEVLDFDLLASRVAYVADGDEGGAEHVEKKLKPSGVLPEQVAFLGGEESGLTLEDLIDVDLWVELVNEQLRKAGAPVEYDVSLVPPTARMRSLEEWCEAQSTPTEAIQSPSKADMSKALLARRKTSKLAAVTHQTTLERLDDELRRIFSVATAHLVSTVEKVDRSPPPH